MILLRLQRSDNDIHDKGTITVWRYLHMPRAVAAVRWLQGRIRGCAFLKDIFTPQRRTYTSVVPLIGQCIHFFPVGSKEISACL